jgi:hypothetical protein
MAEPVTRHVRRALLASALPPLAVAAICAPSTSASFGGSSGCVTLPATPALRSTLLRVHRATITRKDMKTSGPVGRVYYGRCPKAFYALASFNHKTAKVDFGIQDQPERFRRRLGGPWQDRGDTGGFVCDAAPKALLKLWNRLRGCD